MSCINFVAFIVRVNCQMRERIYFKERHMCPFISFSTCMSYYLCVQRLQVFPRPHTRLSCRTPASAAEYLTCRPPGNPRTHTVPSNGVQSQRNTPDGWRCSAGWDHLSPSLPQNVLVARKQSLRVQSVQVKQSAWVEALHPSTQVASSVSFRQSSKWKTFPLASSSVQVIYIREPAWEQGGHASTRPARLQHLCSLRSLFLACFVLAHDFLLCF